MIPGTHPILSTDGARHLEAALFGGDETKEWAAIQRAGCSVGAAVLQDFLTIGGFPTRGRVLVLLGKGHNGADALVATAAILAQFPEARADVVFVFGERKMRPLAMRAWQECGRSHPRRLRILSPEITPSSATRYDLCLDGVFGFQFRPPVDPRVADFLSRVNALSIRLRAAVDLPSAGLFRADFTYATGAVKTAALENGNSGRLRYLDLGFFAGDAAGHARVLTAAVLEPLRRLRPSKCDKRSYGHLFVLGGSRSFPGAVLMAVLAALRSGVGLVTAFVPESLAPAFAARVPEAIWVGWPETPAGALALEGLHLLRERIERASALLMGPGISREKETHALITEIVKTISVPALLDADALQREIVHAAKASLVLTPHAGEFARIAGDTELEKFAVESGATIVLKGPVTRIASGRANLGPAPDGAEGSGAQKRTTIYHSFFGGPVLSRGGSGDLLAGIIGGLLAQSPDDPLLAAARGATWHGLAADCLARAHGEVAVHTTQLLDYLGSALRET